MWLLLNTQRLNKTLLPMFLAKIYDLALREACGAAAGGRFSKAAVKLYMHMGMNPGQQLVVDLNNMNMDYMGLDTLALQLPRRQLALSKATAEQQLVWEALCVLDKAQHQEWDQDIAHMLRQICDCALANFTNNLHNSAAIYERTSKVVMDQMAVHTTHHTIQDRTGPGAGGHEGGAHNTDTHTDDNVHNEQPQAEKPGLSDHMGGKVQQDICLNAAIYGQCTDKQCWHKHDAESIKEYKAALGTKCWEKNMQWWKRICTRQKPSTPKADDTDEAEADTDETEIDKGSKHKGAKKGSMCMLYGDST